MFNCSWLKLKENIIRMDKIDFDFFCQLLKENLCYPEINETLKKKYPIIRGFSVPCIKNFCKKMVYLPEFLKTMSMKRSE